MKPHSRSAHWARIVDGFDANLATVRDYCKRQGVKEHSFYFWRKRLQDQEQKQSANKLTFRLIETPTPLAPVEIILTSGATLRVVCEERALRIVLAALS